MLIFLPRIQVVARKSTALIMFFFHYLKTEKKTIDMTTDGNGFVEED